MKTLACLLCLGSLLLVPLRAFAYGEEGHQAIGCLADTLLKGKPAAAKLGILMEGIPLQQAALVADQIKAWDRDEPFTLGATHKQLEDQLRDFWSANKAKGDKGDQIHRAFHYTDIAIAPEKPAYSDSDPGARRNDIVHISSFCITVLEGTTPETNDYHITKPVAAVLLAHYIGDLHQPLHVGAASFDARGQPANPFVKGVTVYDSRGGNSIDLSLARNSVGNLHHYWDTNAVLDALNIKEGRFNAAVIAPLLPEPADWKPAADIKPVDYPKLWADDILPLAKQAHDRLSFEVTVGSEKKFKAAPKDLPGEKPYDQWAADQVRSELQKAGWRLAYLYEQLLR